jgi:(R)-amidase
MSVIDIAIAQMAVDEGNYSANFDRMCGIIEQCGSAHDLILFPETCLSGFASREHVHATAEPLNGPTVGTIRHLARRLDTTVALGLAERGEEGIYNTMIMVGPEGLIASYRKSHLWSSDRGIFLPGDELRVIPWGGWNVGLLICYDIEFPEPARALARLGATLILVSNGNMSPYGATHFRAACARAQENQIYVVMANRVGQGQWDYFVGESMAIAPSGEPIAHLDDQARVTTARLDTDKVAASRLPYHYLKDSRLLDDRSPLSLATGGQELRLTPLAR